MPGHPNPKETAPMAISMIVELRAKPGRRAELNSRLETVIATQGRDLHGFLASTRHEVLDDDDMLVEIADWESAEARRCTRSMPRPSPRTHPARAVVRALQGHGDWAIALTEPVAP